VKAFAPLSSRGRDPRCGSGPSGDRVRSADVSRETSGATLDGQARLAPFDRLEALPK